MWLVAKVSSLRAIHSDGKTQAGVWQPTTFDLLVPEADKTGVHADFSAPQRGSIVLQSKRWPDCSTFVAQVIALNLEHPYVAGSEAVLHVQTASAPCTIVQLVS